MTSKIKRAFRGWLSLGLMAAALTTACGGHNNFRSGYGNLFVSYSAARSSFASYRVQITSVTLTRSDGVSVNAISAAQIADLAALGDMQELVGNTAIPIGTYVSATVNLDYTNALLVANVNGVPTTASVVDATGAAPKAVSVVVTLDPNNPVVIGQSEGERLDIHFDLEASSTINAAASPAIVTERIFASASNDPDTGATVRIRGPLVSFNSTQQTYSVVVRPFLDESNNLGTLTLFGGADTVYVIDNVSLAGSAGADAVTKLGTGAITTALTRYEPDAKAGRFELQQAYIGASNESGAADRLEGTVISRSGDALTVRGATLNLRSGSFAFYVADAAVTLGPNTVVSVDGSADNTGIDRNSISVGQHLVVLGQASVTNNVVSMDATAGRARLVETRAFGAITSAAAGSIALDLRGFDQWPASVFNFAGTGASAGQDAVASNYLIDTGTFDASTVTGNAVAQGRVAPFGAAPPDFLASLVSSVDAQDATLAVEFSGDGTTMPFSTVSSSALIVNLSDPALGAKHAVTVGPFNTDLGLGSSLSIVPDSQARDEWAIGNAASGISVYSDFGALTAQLSAASTGGKAVRKITAVGRYDAATHTFTARRLFVALL